MYSSSIFVLAYLLALADAHGQILAAVGVSGKSVGFQVDTAIARNCTGISPCQQDATIIRDAEISANIVNECGRTELTGNIDVGENTENALAAGAVTQVIKGTALTVTIHQVNADGAGPYTCDLDLSSNAGPGGNVNLTVTNNVPGANGLSQAKEQDFNMTVTLPSDLACIGGSTGNICTVRCRNNALAGPFGGCFAVQQTDTTASVNDASTITTAQTLDAIMKQIAQNVADLPAAIAANQQAGGTEAQQGLAAVKALLGISITSKASPVQTPAAAVVSDGNANANTGVETTTTSSAAEATKTKSSGKKGKNNNRRETLRFARRMVVADSWEGADGER